MTKPPLKILLAIVFLACTCLVFGQVSSTQLSLAPRLVTMNAAATPSTSPQSVSIIDYSGNQVTLANTIVMANATAYPKGAHAYLLYAGSTVVPMGTPSPVFCRVGIFQVGASVGIEGHGRTTQNVLYLYNPPSGDYFSAWQFTTPVMNFDLMYYKAGLVFDYYIKRNVSVATLQVAFPGGNRDNYQIPWTSNVTMFPGTTYTGTDSLVVDMLGENAAAYIVGQLPGTTITQTRWMVRFDLLSQTLPVTVERTLVDFHAG